MSLDIKGAFILLLVIAAVMFFGSRREGNPVSAGDAMPARVAVPLAGDVSITDAVQGDGQQTPYQDYGPPWMLSPPVDNFIGKGPYDGYAVYW